MNNDIVEQRLLLIARGASRRHQEALDLLDLAEREKRVAWEVYDAHIASQSAKDAQS